MIYYYPTGALGGWTEQTGQTGLGTSTIYVEYPFKCPNPRDGDVDKVYTDSHSTGQVTDNT